MTNAHSITFPEARTIILCACETFRQEDDTDTPEDYAAALVELDRKLSYWLGGPIVYIQDVVDALEELEQLDNGDHPSLIHTANGAIDEGGQIRDNLNDILEDALRDVANSAGIYATRANLGMVAA